MALLPHDIPRMLELIRDAIRPYARAMLFELYSEGRRSPFAQLVACLLSIRTRDEVSLLAARRLLDAAPTPRKLLKLPPERISDLIRQCTFAGQKAATLRRICEILVEDFGGEAPCDFDTLISLPGVGPKCANLVMGIACGEPKIGVDIHVHRVTNRWGYVSAPTPLKTLAQLERRLPKDYWVEINELLVPFGKHICTGARPKCPVCPVYDFCERVGVKKMGSPFPPLPRPKMEEPSGRPSAGKSLS
jgi:endonuclease III